MWMLRESVRLSAIAKISRPATIVKRLPCAALKPVTRPERAHHYALNFSRAWSFFALFEACGDERLLASYLDHMMTSLTHPSWWRGDYRTVAHWVPQFGLFALQRALGHGRQR